MAEEEPPVQGVVARLYSCSTGSRLGTTRTDEGGAYAFTISPDYLPPPSSADEKACFYIQYNVGDFILPNAVFTTPPNSETDDII